MNKRLIIVVLISYLLAPLFAINTLTYQVDDMDAPVESDMSIGVDFGAGMMFGGPVNLYYDLDLKLTKSLRLNVIHRFFDPLSLVIASAEEGGVSSWDKYMPDYFLNSYFKGGVEYPLIARKVKGYHHGYKYYNRSRYEFSQEVILNKDFNLRAGYTHSIGGPSFLTRVRYSPSYTPDNYEIYFNKNWHGVYAGLSLTSRHGLLITTSPESEYPDSLFAGRNVRHSLDAHYYFLTDMITPLSGTHIETQLPMAFEYNFNYNLYGPNEVRYLGGPISLSGPMSFDFTLGCGPFFTAPEGVEFEDALMPVYASLAIGWGIRFDRIEK